MFDSVEPFFRFGKSSLKLPEELLKRFGSPFLDLALSKIGNFLKKALSENQFAKIFALEIQFFAMEGDTGRTKFLRR